MVCIYALILCTSIVYTQTVNGRAALDWNRYTTNQLLESKERSKRAGNLAIVQEIDNVLASRGIVSTITLAQAPEGQEWVLRNKTMVLEQRTDGPRTPPNGAAAGQWIFVDPSWLYLEKMSGNILDTNGIRIGKIGDLESTKGGITPAITQALQEAAQASTRVKEQAEKLLTSERAEYATQRQALEAKIEELEKKAQQAASAVQPTTVTEVTASSSEVKTPEEVDAPAAPAEAEATSSPEGTPEAPSFEGAPEAPEAPPAPPGAPEAPGAPDAPGFGLEDASEKIENKKVLAPLSADELTSLSPEQKKNSDQLFIATIAKINDLFSSNTNNEPYIVIIEKELDALKSNKEFYKRAELAELTEKGIRNCFGGNSAEITQTTSETTQTTNLAVITKCLGSAKLDEGTIKEFLLCINNKEKDPSTINAASITDCFESADVPSVKRTQILDCIKKEKKEPSQTKAGEKNQPTINAASITDCFKRNFTSCLFNDSKDQTFENNITAITQEILTTSDQLFKDSIKKATQTFPKPKDLTSDSYVAIVKDIFKDLLKNKNFQKKGGYEFNSAKLFQPLQDIDLDIFNDTHETYFRTWIAECNRSLFDTAPDADFENDVRWTISFVVAAGRGERDIKGFINSSIAEELSDLLIANLFIESDADTATVEETWLPALRALLTDSQFLKPYGLMVPYATIPPLPAMQILTQPINKTIKDPALTFIISIGAYLSFNTEKVMQKLKDIKGKINTILLKPRHQKTSIKKIIEITPETIGSSFSPHAFANKSLSQVIALIEKIKTKPNALTNALELMKKNQVTADVITRLLSSVGFSQNQIADIQSVLASHQKHFELLKYLVEHMKEYDQEVKKPKNSGYKNGKKLYQFIKDTIKDPELIKVFESVDRESDAVYSTLVLYLKAIPNTFTKTIPASLFRQTIEPYGILIKALEAFNTDMSTADNRNKALTRLINSITALNAGKLSVGTDYPNIITASKDSIVNQQLYKGQLDAALQALTNNRFDEFVQAIDTFVAQSATIAVMADDGSVTRSPAYDLIIKTFQESEDLLLLNDIKRILEAINQASYKLPGFEQDTLENLNALIQLKGKLTPIIKLLGTSLAILKIDEYKQKYTDMINADEFLKTAKMAAETKIKLKKSLLGELDALTARIQAVQSKKPSTPGN